MANLKRKNVLLVILAIVLVCIPVIGYAAVNAENSFSYGDINGDGEVNTKDLVRLMKYIANDGEGIEAHGTDLNGDKKTDAKDLVRLMKYIANGGDSSDGSSSDSVTTAPVDTDAPEPDNFTIENYFDGGDRNEIVAFADGQIYAFSGLRGFFGYTQPRRTAVFCWQTLNCLQTFSDLLMSVIPKMVLSHIHTETLK